MRLLAIVLLPGLLLAPSGAPAQPAGPPPAAAQDAYQPHPAITLSRSGSLPIATGPANHFTGAVQMETLFDPRPPARTHGVRVTFAPGARTAWHSHPLGQILIVTAGSGLVQQGGGPIQEIHPGDVVWIPPNTKHWHGAGPTTSMTHTAIYETPEGQGTTWMEQVSDKEYRGAR